MIVIIAIEFVVMDIVWYFPEKAVGAQIQAAGGALPAKSLDVLYSTGVICTRDVEMPQS